MSKSESLILEYVEQIPGTLLTADEERALAARIAAGDAVAKETLIRGNLRLVIRIARNYLGNGLDIHDLVGAGNLGLIRAAEDFNPHHDGKDIRFSTYAVYWIKAKIIDELGMSQEITIPRNMRGLLLRWDKMRATLQETNSGSQEPTFDEIADALLIPQHKRRLVRIALDTRSRTRLGSVNGDEPFDDVVEMIPDRTELPAEGLIQKETVDLLMLNLGRLPERMRTILVQRFGMDGQPPMTLEEIADQRGMTSEGIRKIEKKALEQLAELMKRRPSSTNYRSGGNP